VALVTNFVYFEVGKI